MRMMETLNFNVVILIDGARLGYLMRNKLPTCLVFCRPLRTSHAFAKITVICLHQASCQASYPNSSMDLQGILSEVGPR